MTTDRRALLAEYIAERLKVPFAWGTNDCMTFSIGWAERATGKRLLPDELWDSEYQAARTIRDHGGLVQVLSDHFTPLHHANYAQDGDLAICAGVVSVVSGAHVVAPGKDGLTLKPRTGADHAWSI